MRHDAPVAQYARALALALGLVLGMDARPADAQAPEPSPAAGEMLESMREKGILSEEEYQDLYRRQALYELRQREASQLPGWVRDWTFGGDLRLRWERIDRGGLRTGYGAPLDEGSDAIEVPEEPGQNLLGRASGDRERGRMRLRLGAERRVGENFLVGFRIGTSSAQGYGLRTNVDSIAPDFTQSASADARSMNTSFGDYFTPKEVFLDRAYLRFAPAAVNDLRLTFGKFSNSFRSREFPADVLIWDPDLQIEGAELAYGFDLYPERVRLDLVAGYAFLDEVGSVSVTTTSADLGAGTTIIEPDLDDADPYMYAFQGGLSFAPSSWLRFGVRGSYYDLRDLGTGFSAATEALGNTGGAISNNALNYLVGDPHDPSSPEFATDGRSRGRMRQFVSDAFARFSAGNWSLVTFAQSSQLLDVIGGENQGWAFGAHLDTPLGTRLTVLWARVERNGTIALFTDSDLFEGFTNAKGYYIALQHPISRNVAVRAAFFSSEIAQERCTTADGFAGNQRLCDTANLIGSFRRARKNTLDRKRFQVDLQVQF